MTDPDASYWATLHELFAQRGYTPRDILATWSAYVQRHDLPRFLSHYELFKQVVDLPGCVVELGVYRGASLFTWSALMETFCPFDVSRRIYGFDSFRGLPALAPEDGAAVPAFGKREGAFRTARHEVEALVALHNAEAAVPDAVRTQLVVGDLEETLPRFLATHPGLRIALLHFDMDLYDATRLGLELLYPLLVRGGIAVFDEYGLPPWEGETRAVDEYFAKRGEGVTIRKHPFTQSPHGFLVKP